MCETQALNILRSLKGASLHHDTPQPQESQAPKGIGQRHSPQQSGAPHRSTDASVPLHSRRKTSFSLPIVPLFKPAPKPKVRLRTTPPPPAPPEITHLRIERDGGVSSLAETVGELQIYTGPAGANGQVNNRGKHILTRRQRDDDPDEGFSLWTAGQNGFYKRTRLDNDAESMDAATFQRVSCQRDEVLSPCVPHTSFVIGAGDGSAGGRAVFLDPDHRLQGVRRIHYRCAENVPDASQDSHPDHRMEFGTRLYFDATSQEVSHTTGQRLPNNPMVGESTYCGHGRPVCCLCLHAK